MGKRIGEAVDTRLDKLGYRYMGTSRDVPLDTRRSDKETKNGNYGYKYLVEQGRLNAGSSDNEGQTITSRA